jgi:hypothetical protein
MSVCCECCVLSGSDLCDELITRPEESYRLWCVVVCDLETSWIRRPLPTGGLLRQKQTNYEGMWRCESLARRILKLDTGWKLVLISTPGRVIERGIAPFPII